MASHLEKEMNAVFEFSVVRVFFSPKKRTPILFKDLKSSMSEAA